MPQENFLEHHIEAWKKYRNVLFHEDEKSALRYLVPDKDYIHIAIETAARLAKKDVEDPEFSDLLRVANDELSREFFQTSKTNFQSIYHICAYATDFGSRSVAEIQASLMEYFINYEHAQFGPQLRVLDLGSGTGASTYGLLSLLDYFSKDNKIFAGKLKNISVDLVDQDDQAYMFCDELCHGLEDKFMNLNLKLEAKHEDAIKFVNKAQDSEYDIIFVSKMLCELPCMQSSFISWDDYDGFFENLLKKAKQALIVIETPLGRNKSLIVRTANLAGTRGANIYSPCPKETKCINPEGCWLWKNYKYLQPDEAGVIRPEEYKKIDEAFFQLIITRTSKHISDAILEVFPLPDKGAVTFKGALNVRRKNTCMHANVVTKDYPEVDRGKYIFSTEKDGTWEFSIDIDRYWRKVY